MIDGAEAAGCAVVFSAGNEGPGAQSIGSPPDRITTPTNGFAIGAVDARAGIPFPFPIASFSSRGPSGCPGTATEKIKPEVSAPGVEVYSTLNNGGYGGGFSWSGTSMAGPHVSGIVALMRQANPDLSVTAIKQIIMSTARDLGVAGEDNTFGWGIPDAYAAVSAALQTAAVGGGAGASSATLRFVAVKPNPFNPSATITYEVPAKERVELKIFDVGGRLHPDARRRPGRTGRPHVALRRADRRRPGAGERGLLPGALGR